MKELNCDTFLAYLIEDGSSHLRLHASAGLTDASRAEAARLAPGQGIAGKVAIHGRRIVLDSVQSSQDPASQMVRCLGLRAYACHPLIADDKVLGTISFGTRSRDRLAGSELDLMQAFANQLAIAMERRRAEERLRCLHLKEQQHAERLEEEVRARTAQLASANAELMTRNAMLQSLAFQLTETEQRERRRLSEVLHDNLQQLLVAAKFRASCAGAQQAKNGARSDDLEKVDQLLTESINVSRSLAYELSPPILEQFGLGAALKWLADHMARMHAVNVHVDTQEELAAPSVSVFLFGVARELLLNVVKHAGVREAWLEAARSAEETRITVRDQGAGFQAEEILASAGKAAGLGLPGIRERVAVLGGRLDIDASAGGGTRVTVRIPHPVEHFGNSEFK